MKNIKRNDFHSTSKKIMRRLKGKGWIVATSTLAVLCGVGVTASPVYAATIQAVESILASDASTRFEGKADLAGSELVLVEAQKALDNVTTNWVQNTLEQVKAEIERQQELGLEAYVVQWGDTLGILAEATDQDVVELAKANGISDKDLILTGDILIKVLQDVSNVEQGQVQAPVTPVTSETPSTPEAPVTSEKPVTPETPETPVESETPDESDEDESETPDESDEDESETPDESDEDESETPDESDEDESETPDESDEDESDEDETEDVVLVEDVLETEVVKFESETVENAELAEGVERVVQEGKDGVLTITFKVTTTNGEVTSKEEVSREVTTEAVKEIIEFGTKKAEEDEIVESSVTETKSVAFKTENRDNPDLPKGETKVVQEGKDGVETVTYKVTTVNGKETKREEVKREVTTQPVNKIVEIGTKEDVVEVTEVTETESVDFATENRDNADLPEGEIRVVQDGKNGVETITYKVTKVNGKETKREEIKREVTTKPVNKIVEIGTKVAYVEPTVTKTEHQYGGVEIRNEVYDEWNNGSHGVVVNPGGIYTGGDLELLGQVENTYVNANGDTITEVTVNQRAYFSYSPRYITDNTLAKGVYVNQVAPQNGYNDFGYTDVYVNGVYSSTTAFYDHGVIEDAVMGIVYTGTSEVTSTRSWTEFTPIIAGTITTNDPNKSSSESYTVSGSNGYIAINYTSSNGGSAVEQSRDVVDAVYHQVFNGTKK